MLNKSYVPPFDLDYELLDLCIIITEKIGRLSEVANLKSNLKLRKANMIKSIHSTLAIEANTLSLDQVTNIINGKKVIGNEKEIQEVNNAFRLYNTIEELKYQSIEDLLKAHSILMYTLDDSAGNFRSKNVGVYSGNIPIHIAPQPQFVNELMLNLFEWLNTTKVHPLIASAIFHYEFEFIHPFTDGNGRMGRFWHTLILASWNPILQYIPIETIIDKRQEEYYDAISTSTTEGKSNAFIIFSLKALNEILDEMLVTHDNNIKSETKEIQKLMEVFEQYQYPLPTSEIMNELGLKNRASFKRVYIDRAVEKGLIEMTIPDKPNSKHQRYRLVK